VFHFTSDPGQALITGKCADLSKFKVPTLRGLAARAPYFHNGLAKTLMDVVNFYDARFVINFTPQQKADLAAFMGAL
jgi:cytochrome c peroxidase